MKYIQKNEKKISASQKINKYTKKNFPLRGKSTIIQKIVKKHIQFSNIKKLDEKSFNMLNRAVAFMMEN